MPLKLPFSRSKLPNRVVLSYTFDYIIIFVLAGCFYSLDAVEPYHQHFALQNYTLQYPYAVHERVPIPLLLVCSAVVPALIITIYTLVIDGIYSHSKRAERVNRSVNGGPAPRRKCGGRYKWNERLWQLNCGLLGLFLAQGAAFVITGALKNATGKPRPDLIDRCQPKAGSVDPPVYGLSNHSICTQEDNAILKDGFRSFPSGHSSSAWAGLFYLSLYLAAKLHVLDNRGEVWKTFIVLIPTLGASLIAISRIMDARHHPFDVISGSMIGILVAWAAYRQYFPSVSETRKKGRAYPIRTWATTGQMGPNGREKRVYDEGAEPYSKMEDDVSESGVVMGGVPLSPLPPQGTDSGPGSSNHFRDEMNRLNTIHRTGAGNPGQITGSTNPYVHPQMPGSSNINRPTRRNNRRHSYDEDDDNLSSASTGDSQGSDDARYEHSRQPQYYGGYNNNSSFGVPGSTGLPSPHIQVTSEETGYKSPNPNFGTGAGAGAPVTQAGTAGAHQQGETAPLPPVHS